MKEAEEQMLAHVNYVLISSQERCAEDDEDETESRIGRTAIALPAGSRFKKHGFSGCVRDCYGTFVEVMWDGKSVLLGSVYLLPWIRSANVFFTKLKNEIEMKDRNDMDRYSTVDYGTITVHIITNCDD